MICPHCQGNQGNCDCEKQYIRHCAQCGRDFHCNGECERTNKLKKGHEDYCNCGDCAEDWMIPDECKTRREWKQ